MVDQITFPIILHTNHKRKKLNFSRFEPMWNIDPSFPKIVQSSWIKEKIYSICIIDFQKNASLWNVTHFGNLFQKKKRLIHRLNGIQKHLSKKYSPFLLQLQHSLYIEYFNILNQEDIFWKLKSRVNWLNSGDKNTIFFFHNSTLRRRRKNKILALTTDNNSWKESTRHFRFNL